MRVKEELYKKNSKKRLYVPSAGKGRTGTPIFFNPINAEVPSDHQWHISGTLTVKMETLCSRFCADISITTHHISIPLHREAKWDEIEIAVERFWDLTSRRSSTWVPPIVLNGKANDHRIRHLATFLEYSWSIPIQQHPKNQIVDAFLYGQRWRSQKRSLSAKKINCQFFDFRHSPEDPMSISPLVPEIAV